HLADVHPLGSGYAVGRGRSESAERRGEGRMGEQRTFMRSSARAPAIIAFAIALTGTPRDVGAAKLVRAIPNPAAQSSEFGWALAATPDRAVVGAPFARVDGGGSGAAYSFDLTTGALVRTFESPLGSDHVFGTGVGIDASRVFVGALYHPQEFDPNAAYSLGAVFVFDRDSGALERVLEPPPGGSDFGSHVVVADGHVAVSALVRTASGLFEGVYVFAAATGDLEQSFVGTLPF